MNTLDKHHDGDVRARDVPILLGGQYRQTERIPYGSEVTTTAWGTFQVILRNPYGMDAHAGLTFREGAAEFEIAPRWTKLSGIESFVQREPVLVIVRVWSQFLKAGLGVRPERPLVATPVGPSIRPICEAAEANGFVLLRTRQFGLYMKHFPDAAHE